MPQEIRTNPGTVHQAIEPQEVQRQKREKVDLQEDHSPTRANSFKAQLATKPQDIKPDMHTHDHGEYTAQRVYNNTPGKLP